MKLHADILRPRDLPKDAKTPVILSIGPYFDHSGQVGAAGPVEDADPDPIGRPGPSDRSTDFVDGAKLMQRGYTFVMVDLRGLGGSSGCLGWGRARRAGRRRRGRRVDGGTVVLDRRTFTATASAA